MRVLTYQDLNLRRVRPAFDKFRKAIEAGDFRSAQVRKLSAGSGLAPYWRAKLDDSNRLLLQFARRGDETVCLALEVIENHAYEKSRFLRGAGVDDTKLDAEPPPADPATLPAGEVVPLRWLPGATTPATKAAAGPTFELLDKPIFFDDTQEAVRRLPCPVVVVGSAGSGKTAVTLAKLREANGSVLYVTHSAYLAQSARALYASHGYENPHQEPEFLSYRELLETLRVPDGREVSYPAFAAWVQRHRQALRTTLGDADAHALFEEFRGVIGSAATGPLTLDAYRALGPRQSLFGPDARDAVHGLFGKYRDWLRETGQSDLNLVAHEWRALAAPTYDFVLIDEVQDLTPVQLALVLALLKAPGQFLLCGDSNQIVHPNFFSWAAVRTLFWQGLAGAAAQRQDLSVLQANFRNTRAVTQLANAVLKIKHARFGSIDRESNFLVRPATSDEGSVRLLPAKDSLLRDLDTRTRASARHAVIVLRDEDKAAARQVLHTPLVFSVHEAKGLEYPHVILYRLVSDQRAAYADICDGVTPADLQADDLAYRRARDKADKSLELYKFYVNAFYVALTRAVETLTLVEQDTGHPLLQLLDLKPGEAGQGGAVATSSKEEWAQEARRLELQGKQEQAQAIREAFLKRPTPPWTPWSEAWARELLPKVVDPKFPSSKQRNALYEYALWHGQHRPLEEIVAAVATFVPMLRGPDLVRQRHLQPWASRQFKDVLRQCDQYGVDHCVPEGATPLMMAARAGNLDLVDALLARGADAEQRDDFGHTAWWLALNRAGEDAAFAERALAGLAERLMPAALDVQTAHRLVRLVPTQAEYWVLSVMLAGFKTLGSQVLPRAERPYPYRQGFFNDHLRLTLDRLPLHLWSAQRRKRDYVSSVLARAECDSTYRPARQLWVRTRVGHYLPNPQMQLRVRAAAGDEVAGERMVWRPVYDVLNLDWVDAGTGRVDGFLPGYTYAEVLGLAPSGGPTR
ncbi:UvrD-helicase domain-containing protein [Sphaerotilus sp.]|uniref:UvrD-helicase domain-containing protein n=1 Tax=Sphaerotilus sp. TaxID=2093942 RepID=UPI002ACDDDCA|nr:UvrD-helicase domain-containing protein [Sphaerotilus sp.]MDZ7856550.1 UvrD-helicase domain-containing protein [Sphaerotilus sp.]